MLGIEKFSHNKTERPCLNRAVEGTTTEESDTDAGDNVVLLVLALGAEAWRCCRYAAALW
uniref:Uncharacterized protein n=1 Tax=Oryza brachyantha TaxID=4533 RepID=J3LA79_ORYBR